MVSWLWKHGFRENRTLWRQILPQCWRRWSFSILCHFPQPKYLSLGSRTYPHVQKDTKAGTYASLGRVKDLTIKVSSPRNYITDGEVTGWCRQYLSQFKSGRQAKHRKGKTGGEKERHIKGDKVRLDEYH